MGTSWGLDHASPAEGALWAAVLPSLASRSAGTSPSPSGIGGRYDEPAGVEDLHFHPVDPISLRVALTARF